MDTVTMDWRYFAALGVGGLLFTLLYIAAQALGLVKATRDDSKP